MSKIKINEEKNKRLKEVLNALSNPSLDLQNPAVKKEFYLEFESIYWLGDDKELYRHLYSDFFDTITNIDNSPTNDIETLVQNIRKLCVSYNSKYSKTEGADISDALLKLYDHISLDVRRLQYTKRLNYEHQGRLLGAVTQIAETEKNIDKQMKEAIEEVKLEYINYIDETKKSIIAENKKEASKMKSEYISILGIFSSIVLAFVGGMAFSTSVLENINKASVYRMVLIALIVGMVFFNIICVLMDFIKKIHGNVTNEDSTQESKRTIWWIVNVILIVGILSTCVAYKYDLFEREEQITEQKNQQMEMQTYN